MATPPSDMSLEDAAAVQQDLARPKSQQDDTTSESTGEDNNASSAPANVLDSVPAAQVTSLDSSSNSNNDLQQLEQNIDEITATRMMMATEPSTSEYAIHQGNGGEEASSSIPVAIASDEQQTSNSNPSAQQEKQENFPTGQNEEAAALDTSNAADSNDEGAASSSTLDALLGSLVSAADNATSSTAAVGESEIPSQAIVSEESASEQLAPSSTQDYTQKEDNNTQAVDIATSQGEDQAMSGSDTQDQMSVPSSSMPSASSSYPTVSDLSGPVPGLPNIEIDSSATTNGDSSSALDAQQQQQQSSQPQIEQLPAIQQEATPFGTPTPASATIPANGTMSTSDSNMAGSQENAAYSFNANTAPAAAAAAPQPSTSGSTPLYKPTPLATDPNVARQAAAQLLQSKPQNMSRLAKLRQRVEKDRFDGEAWLELIADAMQKGDLERTREVFQSFLTAFPDNAREWIAYADLELSHGNNDRVNEIFGKCLRTSTSVQLWHFYLTYIRRTNPIDRSNPERAAPARDVITKAFEFSLAHVGADLEAGPIWFDYIEFLKEGEVSGTWEAQQKMDKLRQTYQRAVCIPLNNIELIWQGYDAFENNLNRTTSKKFLQDRSPAYMTARATARQLQGFMSRLSIPPVPRKPDWDSHADQTQLRIWKELLAYEESDPMELGDAAAIRTRVNLAYKKALTHLRFYPEIWYNAAAFARKSDKPDESTAFLKTGMEANPTSLLLGYAYAEVEEAKGSVEECHRVYSTLIERLQAEIDATTASIAIETKEALEEKARIEAHEKAQREQNMMGDNEQNDVGEEVRNQERENIKRAIAESKAERLNELKRLAGSVWIMQMRFARRAEGIQAARAVFSRARKWPHITWQAFEASAMLEMHWNKETKIAINVFEVGLKRFSEEVGFVQRYLDFLIMINDDGNARAVFERTVAKLPADKARPLWERWADYVYQYGDLTSIQKLDARLSEAYPEVATITRFTDRHTYLDLDDMAYIELGADDRDSVRQTRPKSPSPPPAAVKVEAPLPSQPQQAIPLQMAMPNLPGPSGQFGAMPGAPGQNIPIAPPQQFGQQFNDNFGRNFNGSPQQGPPSIDGSVDDQRRRSGGGRGMQNNMGNNNNNKRRRSPSPLGRRGRRPNSPPRVSRHTPPDNFPEGIPWLLSQLPSKTVFAAHGPVLDWQHLMHLIATVHLPPLGTDVRGRNRSISPRRGQPNGPPTGRRRSPDYSGRHRR